MASFQILSAPKTFGQGLATGLSESLNQFASQRLQDIQAGNEKAKFQQALQGLNVPSNYANFISQLPVNQRLEGFQNLPEEYRTLQPSADQSQQISQPQIQGQQAVTQAAQPQQSFIIPGIKDIVEAGREHGINLGKQERDLIQARLAEMQTNPQTQKEMQERFARQQELLQQQVQPQFNKSVASVNQPPVFGKPLTRSEKLAEEKFSFEKGEAALKHAETAYKLSKADIDNILEIEKEAKRDLEDLERMEELEKEGKLDTPGYVQFLERSGLDIPALMDPSSEEFQKIEQNFVRGAKSVYGGNIAVKEMEQFLRTIPSLSQSPEGRKRVIANLKRLKKGQVSYADTMREIIENNNDMPPLNLRIRISKQIEPQLKRISQEFKHDLKKQVPKGQNRLITTAQATAGSILGIPGTVLGGFGKVLNKLTS